jgi:5-methylcytosine-specific restriction endonuclease McrA
VQINSASHLAIGAPEAAALSVTKSIVRNRDKAYERQDGKCYWCKRQMIRHIHEPATDPGLRCTADHVIARSKGGNNCTANIVAACRDCNSIKDNMAMDDWLFYFAAMPST